FPYRPTMTSDSAWTDSVTSFTGGLHEDSGTQTDMRRIEGKGTLSWYLSTGSLGNHELKTGFNYTTANRDDKTRDVGFCTPTAPIESFCNPNVLPGNYQLSYKSGVPDQVVVKNAPVSPSSRLDYAAAFFQDSWSVNRRLTLNLGVRYANDR